VTRPTVREGDNDNRDVRLLQQLLRDLNYDISQIDGDFGPNTRAALEAFQSDYEITEGGEAGPNTWAALEAQFGDLEGLRQEESVQEFVRETFDDAHTSMDPEEQLAILAEAANRQLDQAGVPNAPVSFGSVSGGLAEFNWATWEITVDRADYDAFQAAGEADQNMNSVYHEARHAEQFWTVARVLAGLYDMDADAITAQTQIRNDIAAQAVGDPILQSTPNSIAAMRWYEETFGISPTPAGIDDPTQADAQAAGGSVLREVDEILNGGAADGRRVLARGSNDASEIWYLQEMLGWRGFSPGAIDGDFGENTETAVKSFQRANGLDDDGIVGRLTWEALLP